MFRSCPEAFAAPVALSSGDRSCPGFVVRPAVVRGYLRSTMRHQRPLLDWLLLLALAGLWGTSFLVIKIALREVTPVTLVAARLPCEGR